MSVQSSAFCPWAKHDFSKMVSPGLKQSTFLSLGRSRSQRLGTPGWQPLTLPARPHADLSFWVLFLRTMGFAWQGNSPVQVNSARTAHNPARICPCGLRAPHQVSVISKPLVFLLCSNREEVQGRGSGRPLPTQGCSAGPQGRVDRVALTSGKEGAWPAARAQKPFDATTVYCQSY